MPSRNVTIVNRLGLHARAAAKFVALASRFESEIQVHRAAKVVNGKSIMGVMMLAAGKGTSLRICAVGHDAERALDALAELIADRFQENE